MALCGLPSIMIISRFRSSWSTVMSSAGSPSTRSRSARKPSLHAANLHRTIEREGLAARHGREAEHFAGFEGQISDEQLQVARLGAVGCPGQPVVAEGQHGDAAVDHAPHGLPADLDFVG